MTQIKEEIVQLVDKMPDEKAQYLLQFIREFEITPKKKEENETLADGLEGMRILDSFAGTLPKDFDYQQELEEALEEKYGHID